MTKPKTKTAPKLVVKAAPKQNGGGQFKIEKAVPLPSKKKENPFVSVFSEMAAGDSFLIGKDENQIKAVKYHAQRWGKENDATFAFRNVNDGCRCWKIK